MKDHGHIACGELSAYFEELGHKRRRVEAQEKREAALLAQAKRFLAGQDKLHVEDEPKLVQRAVERIAEKLMKKPGGIALGGVLSGDSLTGAKKKGRPCAPGLNIESPMITGIAKPDHTLACSAGNWTGDWRVTEYRWRRHKKKSDGSYEIFEVGNQPIYFVGLGDKGSHLSCIVMVQSPGGDNGCESRRVWIE